MSSGNSVRTNLPESCLLEAVAELMRQHPTVEAITISPGGDRSLRVATMGKEVDPTIQAALLERVRQWENNPLACGCDGGKALPAFLRVDRVDDVTTVSKVTCPTAPKFWHWSRLPWPTVSPRVVKVPENEDLIAESRHQLVGAILCGVFGLAGFFLGSHPLSHWCYAVSFIAGGWFPAIEVWEVLQERVLDVHFLMLAVAAGSASIGAYGEGAMLLFLFSLSGALEHYAMGRTQREIGSLLRSAPKTARRLDADGVEHEVDVTLVVVGDRLLIRPGEVFPTDGEVAKGSTAVDESTLTGEAVPVDKLPGDIVSGGTLNVSGAAEVTVTRLPAESALQRVVRLIQQAQHLKAPSQRFTDRFGSTYTYSVLGLSLVMFLVWWLGMGRPPWVSTPETRSAFYLAMTLLVVSSPCALVLSIPSAILAAIAWAARRGILFRGGAAVEKLAEIDLVAMDKTGTLTTGELQVALVESFPPGAEALVLQSAYTVERLSAHPLARAITAHGRRQRLPLAEPSGFNSVTGQGVEATLDSAPFRLGRREWVLNERSGDTDLPAANISPGLTEVWIRHGDIVGRILLKDEVRKESRATVEQLQERGIPCIVLTGDRHAAAERLKESVGVGEVRAELKPEDKVAAVVAWTNEGRKVAMIGDGVNDAPSLVAAHVGVAMGSRGSDAAMEQAEVVLMHDRLENFVQAYLLSKRARRIIRQNIVISLGTVVVLVVLSLFGKVPLTLGVLGHEGSTVVVVMNSLRLLFPRMTKEAA